MSAPDGLAILRAVRAALATKEGSRLAREIRALTAQAVEGDEEGGDYATRIVARAYARVTRPRERR